MNEAPHPWRGPIQWIGLVGGPISAGLLFWLLPDEYRAADGTLSPFSEAGRVTLAAMAWMAVWWITEAVEIPVTALLPLVLFPMTGAASFGDAAAPYSHPMIYLFLGGFVIARSMQHWHLDRRIALLTLRLAGTRPPNMVAGFMLTTAALSAFVSNTATTAMMVPIAMSVVHLVHRQPDSDSRQTPAPGRDLAVCLMLAIAYSASIGGMATIIGTPPNALLVAFTHSTIETPYRMEITFARWLAIGLPLTLIYLPIVWFLLTHVLYRVGWSHVAGGNALIREELRKLGPTSRGERVTAIVFAITAVSWITRPWLVTLGWSWEGASVQPLAGLTDAGIAMAGAVALFVIPVDWKKRRFTMNWEVASRLPWGILVLFGGGLSLAAAVKVNGVALFLASLAHHFAGAPAWVIVLLITAAVVFLTELTSNAATTATLLPVLAALAIGLGIHPYLLIFSATLAASCAFMMPVATPPNAIVFGSGCVRMTDMMRAGLWLNVIGIALITLLTVFWYGRFLTVP